MSLYNLSFRNKVELIQYSKLIDDNHTCTNNTYKINEERTQILTHSQKKNK